MKHAQTLILVLLTLTSQSIGDETSAPAPITEEEAREFCEMFAAKFFAGDGPWLEEHINIAGMVWRATDNASDEFSRNFRIGALKKENGQTGSIREFVKMKDQFEDYRFRRVRKVENIWKGLFRLLASGDGVNYHEIDLVRKTNGEVGVAEFFVFLTGETLTETFRQIYLEAKKQAQKDPNAVSLQSFGSMVPNMRRALAERNFQTVLDLFDKLPAEFKKVKSIAAMRVQAAANLEENQYQRVMAEYEKDFPNDPSIDLMCIDGFFLAKKYRQCREALDRLNVRLGGDGHIAFLKATTYFMENKFPEAIAAARAGIKDEEDFQKLHEVLLNLSLKQKDHRLTKEMLETLGSKFGFVFEDLKTVPEYRDFVQSSEYADWRKAREADEAPPDF